MKIYKSLAAGAIITFMVVNMVSSYAKELTGTLKKINETGIILLGYRESSMPFSYYDNHQEVIGYSQDFASEIVKALKQKLSRQDLKVKPIPITSQTQILLLQNGIIDLECGSTTNDLARQKQVAFSNTIFVVGTRLMTKKGANIHDFPDLKGKTVVTTAGTTSERLLHKMNQDKHLGMHIISAKDHSAAFLMLSTNRAAAFMMDDALLAGERANSAKPAEFIITGTPQSYEAYGCMLRKNDPAFKQVVDDTIARIETPGQAETIYKKWFESPIPPKGVNLAFPASDAIKQLYKHPNDKAIN